MCANSHSNRDFVGSQELRDRNVEGVVATLSADEALRMIRMRNAPVRVGGRRNAIFNGHRNFRSEESTTRAGNGAALVSDGAEKEEPKQISLKDLMEERIRRKEEEKEKEDRIDEITMFKNAMAMWTKFQWRGACQMLADCNFLVRCTWGEFFWSLKKFLVLLCYQKGELLFNARTHRDKERKLLNFLIPYTIPLVSYSRLRRILYYEFYLPRMVVVFKLLENQFSSTKLVFRRINILFYVVLFAYSIIRKIGPSAFAAKVAQTVPLLCPSPNPANICAQLVLSGITEILFNIRDVFRSWKMPVNKHETDYIFLFVFMYAHCYIQSLDIFKLEFEFMKRHIHLVFSPTSFLFYCYAYLFLTMVVPYSIVCLLFKSFYIAIPFLTVICIVVTTQHYLGNVVNHALMLVVLFVLLVYHSKLDSICHVQFFERTEVINPILLSFQVSMSYYGERFRLASLVRLGFLLFMSYVNSVYRISRYNNK